MKTSEIKYRKMFALPYDNAVALTKINASIYHIEAFNGVTVRVTKNAFIDFLHSNKASICNRKMLVVSVVEHGKKGLAIIGNK